MLAPVVGSFPIKTMPPLATVAVSVEPPSPQLIVATYSSPAASTVPLVVRLPGSVNVATTFGPVEADSAVVGSAATAAITTAGSEIVILDVGVEAVTTPS